MPLTFSDLFCGVGRLLAAEKASMLDNACEAQVTCLHGRLVRAAEKTVPTLYETMRTWLDGQRELDKQDPDSYAAHQIVIDRLVERLGRHRSLADLAASYYGDGDWWMYVVQ